jgi:pyruvate formate lyase activating enzyme
MSDYIVCDVCPHACRLRSGDIGACGARGFFPGSEKNDVLYFDINRYEKTDNRKTRRNDHTIPVNYGIATSLALDPIEKKPLNHFFPGSRILSFGSFGCNLKCPFCQNH